MHLTRHRCGLETCRTSPLSGTLRCRGTATQPQKKISSRCTPQRKNLCLRRRCRRWSILRFGLRIWSIRPPRGTLSSLGTTVTHTRSLLSASDDHPCVYPLHPLQTLRAIVSATVRAIVSAMVSATVLATVRARVGAMVSAPVQKCSSNCATLMWFENPSSAKLF